MRREIEFISKVISEGRVTIPKRIRELLGIREGDYIKLELIEVKREVVQG